MIDAHKWLSSQRIADAQTRAGTNAMELIGNVDPRRGGLDPATFAALDPQMQQQIRSGAERSGLAAYLPGGSAAAPTVSTGTLRNMADWGRSRVRQERDPVTGRQYLLVDDGSPGGRRFEIGG